MHHSSIGNGCLPYCEVCCFVLHFLKSCQHNRRCLKVRLVYLVPRHQFTRISTYYRKPFVHPWKILSATLQKNALVMADTIQEVSRLYIELTIEDIQCFLTSKNGFISPYPLLMTKYTKRYISPNYTCICIYKSKLNIKYISNNFIWGAELFMNGRLLYYLYQNNIYRHRVLQSYKSRIYNTDNKYKKQEQSISLFSCWWEKFWPTIEKL